VISRPRYERRSFELWPFPLHSKSSRSLWRRLKTGLFAIFRKNPERVPDASEGLDAKRVTLEKGRWMKTKPYRVAASTLLCRNTFGVGSDGLPYQGWAVTVPTLRWHTEPVPGSPGKMICGFGFNPAHCRNGQSSDERSSCSHRLQPALKTPPILGLRGRPHRLKPAATRTALVLCLLPNLAAAQWIGFVDGNYIRFQDRTGAALEANWNPTDRWTWSPEDALQIEPWRSRFKTAGDLSDALKRFQTQKRLTGVRIADLGGTLLRQKAGDEARIGWETDGQVTTWTFTKAGNGWTSPSASLSQLAVLAGVPERALASALDPKDRSGRLDAKLFERWLDAPLPHYVLVDAPHPKAIRIQDIPPGENPPGGWLSPPPKPAPAPPKPTEKPDLVPIAAIGVAAGIVLGWSLRAVLAKSALPAPQTNRGVVVNPGSPVKPPASGTKPNRIDDIADLVTPLLREAYFVLNDREVFAIVGYLLTYSASTLRGAVARGNVPLTLAMLQNLERVSQALEAVPGATNLNRAARQALTGMELKELSESPERPSEGRDFDALLQRALDAKRLRLSPFHFGVDASGRTHTAHSSRV